ncbi:NAD(P)-dependent oxidoreductase [Microbacterium sp. NEAU-LLC]|uniref:NAD(P)-dependent oxidoreductase n=1 Tax=Microbacterium helvum TaxID=2773713 RepID=A0ABR8NMY7_9MICO|nr:NAD(P)-dependent oxidoreductase [Microbacterium helvum]MBD3942020.1 NAD(P)-dependent oxidoreductase [Microbacterium helvum]
MSRVVVTGAGGYIGPHVVTALLDRGNEVVATVRRQGAVELDPRARVVEADILEDDFDPDIWGPLPDAVVHLAWKDGFRHNSPAHMSQLSSHFRLLTRLAENGVARIVALGTMHEVGYWEGPIQADTPTSPLSQYGIAKDALRRALPLALPETASLAWVRAYYIYGDDRRSESIFRKLLDAADQGRTAFPFTTGRNLYDFIPVDELGRQIAALTDAHDVVGTVNCCSGTPKSLAAQVEDFIAAHDLGLTLEYGAFPDRPYDSPGVWGDATIIREVMAREGDTTVAQ